MFKIYSSADCGAVRGKVFFRGGACVCVEWVLSDTVIVERLCNTTVLLCPTPLSFCLNTHKNCTNRGCLCRERRRNTSSVDACGHPCNHLSFSRKSLRVSCSQGCSAGHRGLLRLGKTVARVSLHLKYHRVVKEKREPHLARRQS